MWAAALALTLALALGCSGVDAPPAPASTEASPVAAAVASSRPPAASTAGPGFRRDSDFREHFQKHGREFGDITGEQYLAQAQQLRDAPVGGPILEIVREVDGVITRFDRDTGSFGAYNSDGTIRTFFIPNDGEAYFRRQAARRPQ